LALVAKGHPTDAKTVAATWDEVRDQLAARFPKIGPLMDDAKTEVHAFTGFPRAHWSEVWLKTRWARRSGVALAWSGSSERRQRHPAGWRRLGRHARQMARWRTPLFLRSLDSAPQTDRPYWQHRRNRQ
jgi:hypothetical protein